MAITSTKTFTETVDFGEYGTPGRAIETDAAYYGTLQKTSRSDVRDVYNFTPTESGYYRISWEFSRPQVIVIVGSDINGSNINRTKIEGERLIAMQEGHTYYISFNFGREDNEGLNYGFDLRLSGERATNGDDLFKGNGERNTLFGFEGNDTIIGFAKGDQLFGGAHNDLLSAGGGKDSLYGGDGDDTLIGGAGGDMIFSSAGTDVLSGGSGNDVFGVGESEDVTSVQFFGGADEDSARVTFGVESRIEGWLGAGNDEYKGSTRHGGDLTLYGDQGYDEIYAPAFSQYDAGLGKHVYANIGDVSIYGGESYDELIGSGDLYGGADNDILYGTTRSGGESNRLYGGEGADILRGALHGGNLGDFLHGGIGNDRLSGSTGRDTLDGGLGRDTIFGSTGRDRILLGADVKAPDVVQYTHVSQSKSSFGLDRISGFTSGIDVLDFEGIDASDTAEGNQILLYGGETALANGLWHQLVGGDTHVFLDVDGDALADLQVILKGVTTVAEGDFIL